MEVNHGSRRRCARLATSSSHWFPKRKPVAPRGEGLNAVPPAAAVRFLTKVASISNRKLLLLLIAGLAIVVFGHVFLSLRPHNNAGQNPIAFRTGPSFEIARDPAGRLAIYSASSGSDLALCGSVAISQEYIQWPARSSHPLALLLRHRYYGLVDYKPIDSNTLAALVAEHASERESDDSRPSSVSGWQLETVYWRNVFPYLWSSGASWGYVLLLGAFVFSGGCLLTRLWVIRSQSFRLLCLYCQYSVPKHVQCPECGHDLRTRSVLLPYGRLRR